MSKFAQVVASLKILFLEIELILHKEEHNKSMTDDWFVDLRKNKIQVQGNLHPDKAVELIVSSGPNRLLMTRVGRNGRKSEPNLFIEFIDQLEGINIHIKEESDWRNDNAISGIIRDWIREDGKLLLDIFLDIENGRVPNGLNRMMGNFKSK